MDKLQIEKPKIDQKRRGLALQHIAEAAEQKKQYYVPSVWEILRGQIRYTSRYCLGGQIIFSAAVFLLLWYFKMIQMQAERYLTIASVMMAFTGIFLVMELGRSRMAGMSELEETCYLNLKQIWCMKMVLFGGIDLTVFFCAVWILARSSSIGAGRLLLYLLVPFVLSNAGYLLVFSVIRGKEKYYAQIGMAVLASFGAMILTGRQDWYTPAHVGAWVMVLAAASAALGIEITMIVRRTGKGEEICWN